MRSTTWLECAQPTRSLGIATAAWLFLSVGQSAFAQIEVTEIMFNPNDDAVWEWIEVRNTGNVSIDLDGYLGFNLMDQEVVGPNPTIDGTSAANTSIGAGEVAVIYDGFIQTGDPQNFMDENFRKAWGLSEDVPLLAASFWPGLSNSTGSDGQSIAFWADETDYLADISAVEDDPVNAPGVLTNRVTSFAHAAFSINYSNEFPDGDGDGSIAWNGNGSNAIGSNWVLSQAGVNDATTSLEVQVPGLLNSPDDIGNPGIAPPGSPSAAGLHITEILYDSAGAENDWEWVEVYNSTAASIDLAGYVIDDINGQAQAAANIAGGSVGAGETAILFNVDDVAADVFAAAWGASLNLVPVTDWDQMSLNNGGDTIGLWSDFASYSGDHQTHANAVVSQTYDENAGFPTLSQGPSISLADLGLDPADGGNWDNAVLGDLIGSFNATGVAGGGGTVVFHAGGDIGSPGIFATVAADPADLNGDGVIDGLDLGILLGNFNQSGVPAAGGELNGLDPVDGLDLGILLGSWSRSAPSAVVGVPEPTSMVLVGLALAIAPTLHRQRY